jgi:hypothetical protein
MVSAETSVRAYFALDNLRTTSFADCRSFGMASYIFNCSYQGKFKNFPGLAPPILCTVHRVSACPDRLVIYRSTSHSLLPESGVGSRESGVGSRESGVGSRESGVGSRESGVGSSCVRMLRYQPVALPLLGLRYLPAR